MRQEKTDPGRRDNHQLWVSQLPQNILERDQGVFGPDQNLGGFGWSRFYGFKVQVFFSCKQETLTASLYFIKD